MGTGWGGGGEGNPAYELMSGRQWLPFTRKPPCENSHEISDSTLNLNVLHALHHCKLSLFLGLLRRLTPM